MSHLRAPAARADRREGGRHGRPAARPAPALPETHIRPRLVRLAVFPSVAVALGATAAVLFVIRSTGARPGPGLWAVLTGAVVVAATGILIAVVAADREARSVADRLTALRRGTARGEAELRALVGALQRGEAPEQRGPRRRPPEGTDGFGLLAADLARAHDGAVTAVLQAAQLSSQAGSERKLEVFVNLARRLQSLVHREISLLDDLENEIEDPDLLKGLFHVDHLATRIRRHAENLAVLGGAVSRRQWSNPVDMTEVLRSAIAEVEQYSRVKLVPPVDGELRGHAVADVIHLLAELVENATVFSAPHTQVLLRASLVTSGLAVEVEDRGLGMSVGEQHRMNALLADPNQVNVASLLADGRIGLYVVSQLARRHNISVCLQTNIYGGVQAVLVVPRELLGPPPAAPGAEDCGLSQSQSQLPVTGRPPVPRPQLPHGTGELLVGAGRGQERPDGAGGAPAAAGRAQSGPAPTGDGADSAGERPPEPARVRTDRAPAAQRADERGGERSGTRQARAAGRRRHAQRGGRGAAAGNGGEHGRSAQTPGAQPPLPVRGAHELRSNPAEAVPGVSPGDRPAVEAHAGALSLPRGGTAVRGTMDKPRLPRRRAQEHLVPQLRGGPAPRQDSDTAPGHDPGLMAAFQRGIELAGVRRHIEAGCEDPSGEEFPWRGETPRTLPTRMPPTWAQPPHEMRGCVESAHLEPARLDAAHMVAAHTDAPHRERTDPAPMDAPPPTESVPTESAAHPDQASVSPVPPPRAHTRTPAAGGTGRPDGSAPAG
ncbi:ATP-binding protein [Streptomyces sp. TG1A-8]|uniref:sensor histidine kinase n=1 Tax=Streptomyces sp. TG1A-8 TaxID=3051385 RepID=UPI00265C2858|nr:ATP-binding protein [Streptomyces sp. TG1A-8]MDO0924754.1 ATP-binding protein [Streptomyces sp. TG1A-8]